MKLKELEIAEKTLDLHKAEDIKVIDVSDMTPFASYYVLATASNYRFLGALSDILEEAFEKEGIEITGKDGNPESGWMIMGAGDVVIHLFLDVNRKEIDLEGLIEHANSKRLKK